MNWGNTIPLITTGAGAGVGGFFGGPMGAFVGASAGGAIGNYWMQQGQYDYEKRLQSEIFGREDASIVRRVADLKAAGLSPVLAAGQGASSGPVISTHAPQMSDLSLGAMSLMKMQADISTTLEQQKLIQKQVEQAGAMIRATNAEAGIKEHDLSIFKASGMPSNASDIGKAIREVFGFVKGPGKNIIPTVESLTDKVKKGIENSRSPLTPQEREYQEKVIQEGLDKLKFWRK